MERLIILGAGGHGKVAADIAAGSYKELLFFDSNESVKECMGYPVFHKEEQLEAHLKDAHFFVAIGNAEIREQITRNLQQKGARLATLIHPSAIIGSKVQIGEGSIVMAGAIINAESSIGTGCILNTASSVDHECKVSDYAHIAVDAHLCGRVFVGEKTWIGAGAIVSNNVNVSGGCMIGAGAVVVKSIDKAGTYVGVPAKRLDR